MWLFIYNPALLVDYEFHDDKSSFCSPLYPECLASVSFIGVWSMQTPEFPVQWEDLQNICLLLTYVRDSRNMIKTFY